MTLLSTAYKVYTAILADRLEKEVEEKGIVPEWRAGFKKRKGMMDDIYTVMRRELQGRKRVVPMLVDLKAAFNLLERGDLGKRLEDKGISKELTERIVEIYRKTRYVVKMGESKEKGF